MDKYKISIIVPVYNVEKYINKCLDSIINQTYKNLEILFIDDGSTDNSGKICDEYAKKDKRIKVFHQPNSGVSAARNKGLDNITGDYVMFVDPDDWIELNTCEILLNEITKENNDILIFNFYKNYKNGQQVKNFKYDYDNNTSNLSQKIQAKILAPSFDIPSFNIKYIGFTWNKLISAKIIENQRFLLENKQAIFEDGLFYYKMLEKINNIKICNYYLYHYRLLDNSLTKRINKDILDINDEIYKLLISLSKNHQKDKYYDDSLQTRIVMNLYNAVVVYFNNNDLKVSTKERIKLIKKELKKNYYKKAIKKVKLKNLSKKIKIYAILFKIKAYHLILLVNNIEKKIRYLIKNS